MSNEDQRTAVGIWVTLSSQLMAASLAVLAIEVTYLTFVLENRSVSSALFYVLAALAALSFIGSIFKGGKGMSAMGEAGYKETWSFDVGRRFFRRQASLCLIGLIFFLSMLVFSGSSKEDEIGKQILKINQDIGSLQQQIDVIKSTYESRESLSDEIHSIASTLQKMSTDLEQLKKDTRRIERARGSDKEAK